MTFSVNWKEKEKQCLLGGPRTTFMLILIIYNRTLCTAEPPAPARAGSTAAGAGTESERAACPALHPALSNAGAAGDPPSPPRGRYPGHRGRLGPGRGVSPGSQGCSAAARHRLLRRWRSRGHCVAVPVWLCLCRPQPGPARPPGEPPSPGLTPRAGGLRLIIQKWRMRPLSH